MLMHLRLETFDGPLDLLLHLIKTQELNVFNIPIVLITEQYLNFLRQAPDMDFHQAGDYIAMAAQLIEIKAASLIPVLQQGDANSMDELDENDPRKPLVEQLLEWEAIKQACTKMETFTILGRDVFRSGESIRRQAEFDSYEPPVKGDSFSLVIAFESILLKFAEKKNAPTVRVRAQSISIHEKIEVIKDRVRDVEDCIFQELLEECASRYELIVTLMAVLELAKANHVNILQEEAFGPIHLTKGEKFHENLGQIDGEEVPLIPVAQPLAAAQA